MNLVNNAIQSSSTEHKLSIKFTLSKSVPRHLCVSVTDTGAGMSAETLARVQEMFTTTKSQGTGLGLAVVRAVARAHAADFSLTSEQGKGTTATLCIPLIEKENTIHEVSNEQI